MPRDAAFGLAFLDIEVPCEIVVFCLFMLLDSLDTGRFVYLSSIGGLPLALTSIAASAGRWTIRTLSVTVLIGAIIGILDLQTRQELNIIKASGPSFTEGGVPTFSQLSVGLDSSTLGPEIVRGSDKGAI